MQTITEYLKANGTYKSKKARIDTGSVGSARTAREYLARMGFDILRSKAIIRNGCLFSETRKVKDLDEEINPRKTVIKIGYAR